MNVEKLLILIDRTLQETDNVLSQSQFLKEDSEPIVSTRKVLYLFRQEILQNVNGINERVLRAMHDVGMSAYRVFENTPLEDTIYALTSALYEEIPQYKNLEPLRMDFGKGDPI